MSTNGCRPVAGGEKEVVGAGRSGRNWRQWMFWESVMLRKCSCRYRQLHYRSVKMMMEWWNHFAPRGQIRSLKSPGFFFGDLKPELPGLSPQAFHTCSLHRNAPGTWLLTKRPWPAPCPDSSGWLPCRHAEQTLF